MELLEAVHAVIGPPRCEGCGRRPGPLCAGCRARIGRAPPVEAIAGVERALVPWDYEGPARALVLALKLRGARVAAEPLADAMADEVLLRGLGADIIAWVPGRRRDIRRRGFDHAELLARRLARRVGLPRAPLVVRIADPPDQASLGRQERRRNLAGAFAARPAPERVALVDDLVTTGSTAAACARALRAAGARRIEVVAPCRA